MDNDLLSLTELSIERIPVDRQDFEKRLGVCLFPDEESNNTKNHHHADESNSSNSSNSNVYWFRKSHLLVNATTNASSKKKKSLSAIVQKWIERWSRKQKLGIKFLNLKNNGGGGGGNKEDGCGSSLRAPLDQYVHKLSRNTKNNNNTSDSGTQKQMGCALLAERSPTTALALNHPNGILWEGQVHEHSTHNNNQHDAAILQCAACLYYQLWYFRTIQAKHVPKAHGFAVSTTTTTGRNTSTVWVTLLLLEQPQKPIIGGRYPLYEYTQRYDTTIEGDDDDDISSNNTDDGENYNAANTRTTSTILNELAHFVLSQQLPCPFLEASQLDHIQSSPGYMLLPQQYQQQQQQQQSKKWNVIPTITGSLVIRCQGDHTVLQLLQPDPAAAALVSDIQNLTTENREDNSTVWYIKYKTPPLGLFWDTAKIAINGTRSLLQQQQRNRRKDDDNDVIQEWLHMYPVNSHISDHTSITVMRSVGCAFLGQLSWKDFKVEFASLMNKTVYFQIRCNNLIHGDINEGNVLYDESANMGSRLRFIDWDEALRGRPCHRQVGNEEERLRYPLGLVDFPEQYTRQQLLHLFSTIMEKHYPVKAKDGIVSPRAIVGHLLYEAKQLEGNDFLGRSAVDARFAALLEFLQRTDE